jgi:FhaA, N-terminal domain/FHA domain
MLARFERLIEQAVEGSLRRVFPAALQPIQLDKAAARAMEQAQVIGRRGRDVPNVYELRIAPSDLSRFGDYRQTLGEDVRRYLVDYAHERGLRPVGELSVQLIEDPTVRGGSVFALARFVGLPAAEQQELEVAVESTRQLRLAQLARSAAAGAMPLMLRDTSGLQFALEPSLEVVRLGRGVDNDVVLASSHVSRYHAQLRRIEASWLAYDLDSTNGTWVDDEKLLAGDGRAVRAGSRLRVGDHELEVRAVKAAARGRR